MALLARVQRKLAPLKPCDPTKVKRLAAGSCGARRRRRPSRLRPPCPHFFSLRCLRVCQAFIKRRGEGASFPPLISPAASHQSSPPGRARRHPSAGRGQSRGGRPYAPGWVGLLEKLFGRIQCSPQLAAPPGGTGRDHFTRRACFISPNYKTEGERGRENKGEEGGSDFSSVSGSGRPRDDLGEYSGTENDFGRRTKAAARSEPPEPPSPPTGGRALAGSLRPTRRGRSSSGARPVGARGGGDAGV